MATVVIGVVADDFRGTDVGIVSEFWIPFSMIDQVESRSGPVTANRTRFWLACVARLRPGVDTSAARAELDVIARTLNRLHARGDDRGFAVERAGQIDPRLRTMAVTLFTVALALTVLVLLTACGNVANLLLGRAAYRRREIAARMALGATRARLVRQLLTESLVLALLGALGGWLIAAYASSLLGFVRTPLGWPVDLSVAPDARVFLFCLVLSVATGVAFGLLPALRATRPDLVTDLKADAGGLSRRESACAQKRARDCAGHGLHRPDALHRSVVAQPSGRADHGRRSERAQSRAPRVRSGCPWAFRRAIATTASRDSRESAGGRWRRVRDIDDRGAFDADHQQLGLRDRRGCGRSTCRAHSGRHLCRRAGVLRHNGHSVPGGQRLPRRPGGNATGRHRQRGVRACGISGPVIDRSARSRRWQDARHRRSCRDREVALDRRGAPTRDLPAHPE